MVEAALVLPIVIMFLFGILEYGRYVMMLQILTNAAREGARYAVTHTNPVTISGTTYGNATTDVTNTINKAMAGTSLSSQNVQFYTSDSLGNNLGAGPTRKPASPSASGSRATIRSCWARCCFCRRRIPVVAQCVMRSESN